MKTRDVRIVLAGDDTVGKSTLITSLIKETFVDRVQAIVPEITLPPEVAPEGVITKIVDTSRESQQVLLKAVLLLTAQSLQLHLNDAHNSNQNCEELQSSASSIPFRHLLLSIGYRLIGFLIYDHWESINQ